MIKRYLASAVAVCTAFSATGAFAQNGQQFAENPFTDVPATHANYEAIEFLRKNNVLKGYEDGTFKADARINRAEFVALITNPFILDTERMNNCITENTAEDDETVFFPDVDRDHWYAPMVCHAKVKKLIDGYTDGLFRPGNQINFAEAAKIIANTFVLQTNSEDQSDTWYKRYVEELDQRNAIPMTITTFGQTMTRGEMAEMIFRLKTARTDKASKTYGQLKTY